ncbi:hypothetical protein [Paenibacillus sp. SYP-B4298]|nr:hypothetical protein [Paenibacillus sp. SYP-B4298]
MTEVRSRTESDETMQARVLRELKPITVFTVITTVLLIALSFFL